MCDNRRELVANFSIAFKQRDLSVASRMVKIKKDNEPADEYVIYCLSQMYGLHSVLFTKHELWSTISHQFNMTKEEIFDKSQIKLIYLGPGQYVEIKHVRQPAAPPPSSLDTESTFPQKQLIPTRGRRGHKPKMTCHANKPS